MGYHVTILRSKDGKKYKIPLERFREATESIHGWQFDTTKSEAIFFHDGLEVVTLWFDKGLIFAISPSERGLDAMIDLADMLGARVRGDEYETYGRNGEVYQHPDDSGDMAQNTKKKEDLRKANKRQQIILHVCVFGSFIGMGLAIKFLIAHYWH